MAETKKCESCGREFGCAFPEMGCWCEEVQVTAEARLKIAEKYKGCLCPECLQREAAGGTGAREKR